MSKSMIRVVTRGTDGSLRVREFTSTEPLLRTHTQIGIDDCSTDLGLRGMPVFRGLIGPIPEGKGIVRYESPEVFETLTKEWTMAKTQRRSRRKTIAAIPDAPANTAAVATAMSAAEGSVDAASDVPAPIAAKFAGREAARV